MGIRAAFPLAFGRFPEGASRRRYSGSPTLSGLKQHWQELQASSDNPARIRSLSTASST